MMPRQTVPARLICGTCRYIRPFGEKRWHCIQPFWGKAQTAVNTPADAVIGEVAYNSRACNLHFNAGEQDKELGLLRLGYGRDKP